MAGAGAEAAECLQPARARGRAAAARARRMAWGTLRDGFWGGRVIGLVLSKMFSWSGFGLGRLELGRCADGAGRRRVFLWSFRADGGWVSLCQQFR